MKLIEKIWRYTIESETAKKFRDSIEEGDLQAVKDSIVDIYEEIFNKGYIDEYDFEEYAEEVNDIELDEDEIDYQISQLYDLCDNLSIFIPVESSLGESVDRKDSEYLDALAFLDENPTAYAYICSAEINGKEMPVGKGIMTSDEYQEYIEKLNKTVKLGRVNTMYQNDKEEHRKALHDSLGENISKDMSAEDIAKKHNVSIDKIKAQVEKGIKIEKEHTDDEKKAERIALDHLFEMPDYYTRLKKMEKGAIKEDTIKHSLEEEIDDDSLTEYEKELCDYMLDNCREDYEDSDDLLGKMDVYYSEFSGLAKRKREQVKDYFEEKIEEIEEPLTEDTIKQGSHWVNKGKEGTHGEFRTKKEADAQRKAMFAQGFKEELNEDDEFGPFPPAKPEKEISMDKIEDLEEEIKDLIKELHSLAEEKPAGRKSYLKSLNKIYDELYNFDFDRFGESLEKKSGEIKDKTINNFDYEDDDFDLDPDKLAEAMNQFSPTENSKLPEAFIQNNSTIISEQNGVVSGKQNIQESANQISSFVDPNMSYDDVCDIELN